MQLIMCRLQVMVPLTSRAFMPGQLVHTNEILVLLGDNWFVETSAKGAAEIAERRIKQCEEMLKKKEEEVKLVMGWQKQVGAVNKDQEETVEITEDYNEDNENEWKKKHRENAKKEKEKEKSLSKEDDDLWKRLDELEVEEALQEEDGETDSESGCDLSDEDDYKSEVSDEVSLTTASSKTGRRVSWAGVDSGQPSEGGNTIKFTHSAEPPVGETFAFGPLGGASVPDNPADLVHFVCREPKSILKHTHAEILVDRFDGPKKDVIEETACVDDVAVQDTVIEREVCEKDFTNERQQPPKVSKFKAARLKSKS